MINRYEEALYTRLQSRSFQFLREQDHLPSFMGIHPNQTAWKRCAERHGTLLTTEHRTATYAKEEQWAKKSEQLYAEIGRLQTQPELGSVSVSLASYAWL